MNVYKMKGQAEGGAVKPELKELKIDPRPAPPYRARVKMADKETQVTPERESVSHFLYIFEMWQCDMIVCFILFIISRMYCNTECVNNTDLTF